METGTFTVASGSALTKTGYTFAGWNDGVNDYAVGDTYTMSTSDVTLTAQWTLNPPTFSPASGSLTAGEYVTINGIANSNLKAAWADAAYTAEDLKAFETLDFNNQGQFLATSSGTGTRVLSVIAYDGTLYSDVVTGTYSVTAGPATITASPATVSISGTNSQNVTLTSNSAGEYSITTSPNSSIATATIDGSTLTVTGVAAGNTSVTVTQAAHGNFTATTKTINITVTGAGTQIVVLEAYGEKVSAGDAFTGKTVDLTSCAFSNKETYSTTNHSSHTANTSGEDVYRSGSQSTITLTLGSTSASSIVVGAKSSSSTARTLSSIQVLTAGGSSWETLSSSTYSVSNNIAGSTVNTSTISGLNIAQGSKVKLTYNSGVLFYFFEVTPVSGGASTDATLKTVVVNGHTLTADGTSYTYNIGTELYASGATIPVTVTPNDASATIVGGTTGENVINATIGTPLNITVRVADGSTTKAYTVNVNSVAKTELGGNSFAVASGASYYEGQQFATTSDKVIASISTNFGYEKISANQRENFADSYYAYNLVTDNANRQDQNGGVPTDGVYYRFATAAGTSGYLQVGMFLMNGKKLYVVDGDGNNVTYTYKFMSDATTELIMTDQQLATAATGYIQFAISANKTYYVYANGSKLSLMGFKYSEVSSDASADFTLKETPVVFTNDAYTYTATTETEGTTLPVAITPATGATVTSVTNATKVSDNNYTITVPSAGSSASATITITAQDGITTETYTIRVDKPIASTTLFNLEVGNNIGSDVKAGAGETVDITTDSPSYASALTGGTAQMGLTDIATKEYTLISNKDYFNFGTNAAYMKIDLQSPLQVGDIIEFTSYGSSDKQFAITTTAVRSTNNLTSGNKYTVTSTLAGKSIIYFWRAEATNSYITKLKITRPTATTDVTVKINNTTVARGSGSGTEVDRYIYSYEIPSDYAGGTVPVSISTTGTISETITSVTAPAYGSTTTKDFSVTAGVNITYYQLSVTRAASSDCTITGATASYAPAGEVTASVSGTNIAVLVPYGNGTSETTVTLGVTAPTGASVSWEGNTNTVSLPGAADEYVTKQVTITAQDRTTQKTYTIKVTRGENDNSYLQVVGDGQEIYLHQTNYDLYKTSGGTKGTWFGSSNSDKFKQEATYDGVTGTWYELKSSRTLTIVAKGAIAYEVYVQNTGDGAREYKVKSSGTDKEKTISAEAKALSSSGLIKTNTDGEEGEQVTITITGLTSNALYPVKIVFYTRTAAKKAVTMSYSAPEWDGTGEQPELTAKDEDNIDVSPVTYESDDTKVATVADDGTVTILPTANGNAMIYATYAGDATHEAASAYFTVIKQQGAKYKQTKDDKQGIGGKAFLYTDGSTYEGGTSVPAGYDILVTATYGGWKYGDEHSYYKSKKEYKDAWGASTTGNVSDGIDGYDYARVGAQDACDEAKETESYYGGTRYGWFHPAEIDDEGKLVSYPFTLPCRGAYMTFEPTVNGMLTLYLHQNGAWNTYDNDGTDGGYAYKKGNIKYGEFRKHAFHIVDQNGVSVSTYTDFATNTKGKVAAKNYRTGEKYYCSVDAFGNATDESENNIATWNEFKNYYTSKERVAIAAAWSSGVKGAQKVVRLDNGSFFITHPASVKYSFYVVAGQTYYVFSNFSKLGFMGMNFVPDTENEVTGSLSLSENEKFSFEDLQKPSGNVSVPQYAEITLDRTFTADNWNTICLPFTMTEAEVKANFGDDTELLVLDHVDMVGTKAEVHLKYHEIQSILAGYPYLIKPSQDCNGIVVNNKIVDPNTELFKIKDGSYTSRGVEGFCNPQEDLGPGKYRSYRLKEGDIFLSGNKLWVSKGASYLKGYRSYFEIAEGAPVPNAVEFSFSSYEDDQETSISILEFSDEALEAFGITRNGVYNLNGQKVADTTENLPAGMYIVNGKKMYVK